MKRKITTWLLAVMGFLLLSQAFGAEVSGASFAGGSGSGAAAVTQVCMFSVLHHGTVITIR